MAEPAETKPDFLLFGPADEYPPLLLVNKWNNDVRVWYTDTDEEIPLDYESGLVGLKVQDGADHVRLRIQVNGQTQNAIASWAERARPQPSPDNVVPIEGAG
jgi:hypothetical protein